MMPTRTHERSATPSETGGETSESVKGEIRMRAAEPTDGAAIWRLVRETGVLDVNSPYAYLMTCMHFGHTSVVAEQDGKLAGFVMSFRPPRHPEAVFVWQVAVAEWARGQGLGGRLLDAVVALPGCRGVRYLEATVTPSNGASRALFKGFARRRGAPCEVSPGILAEWFPEPHEAEDYFRIGPFEGDVGDDSSS